MRAEEVGWVEYSMRLKGDAEPMSREARVQFAASLRAGNVIGVYCGGRGEIDYSRFWLAEVKPKEQRNTSKVTYKAVADDPGWDIKKGAEVLNIRWLERANDSRLCFVRGAEHTICIGSVLPRKVVWESKVGRGGTAAFTLSAEDEDDMVGVV